MGNFATSMISVVMLAQNTVLQQTLSAWHACIICYTISFIAYAEVGPTSNITCNQEASSDNHCDGLVCFCTEMAVAATVATAPASLPMGCPAAAAVQHC